VECDTVYFSDFGAKPWMRDSRKSSSRSSSSDISGLVGIKNRHISGALITAHHSSGSVI
jgi:hypothetical protein